MVEKTFLLSTVICSIQKCNLTFYCTWRKLYLTCVQKRCRVAWTGAQMDRKTVDACSVVRRVALMKNPTCAPYSYLL